MSGDDGVGVITSQHCCQTATAIQLTPMDICLDTWVYFQLFLWGQCRLFLMETYRHLLLFLWWPRPALFPLEGRTAYIHEQNRYFKPKQFSMNLCVVLQKYFLLTFSLAIQLTFHCVNQRLCTQTGSAAARLTVADVRLGPDCNNHRSTWSSHAVAHIQSGTSSCFVCSQT